MEELHNIINRQISGNKELNLFFEQMEDEIVINNTFKEKTLEIKHNSDLDISQIVRISTRAAVDRFYMINQYIQLSSKDLKELEEIYNYTFSAIDSDNFTEIMKQHFNKLAAWLSQFYPSHFLDSLSKSRKIGQVINEEYTVDFQTAIFDIALNELKEPIIDIGCGKNANLVRNLILNDKEAFGIDRIINCTDDRIKEVSWFDFNFERNKWGTIIANMSFTNHLLYSMKSNSDLVCDYYLKYKDIIESLMSGGTFYYAPSLDFIEERLDHHIYSFTRKAINGINITKLTKNVVSS